MKQVLIIGAGRIGKAIGSLAITAGHHVEYWDAVPNLVPNQRPLEIVAAATEVIVLAIPSWSVRECTRALQSALRPEAVLMAFAKGIEVETKKRVDQIFEDTAPNHPWALAGGPMMAEELVHGKGGTVMVGTRFPAAVEMANTLFGSTVRVETTDDVAGVALAGVLKNAYAFGLGIADGLEWGMNRKGWLTSVAVGEMVRLGHLLEAQEATVLGSAGVGDLVCTAFSPHSRNRSVGEEIVRTGRCTIKSEATISIPSLAELAGSDLSLCPFLETLHGIVLNRGSVAQDFERLTRRP